MQKHAQRQRTVTPSARAQARGAAPAAVQPARPTITPQARCPANFSGTAARTDDTHLRGRFTETFLLSRPCCLRSISGQSRFAEFRCEASLVSPGPAVLSSLLVVCLAGGKKKEKRSIAGLFRSRSYGHGTGLVGWMIGGPRCHVSRRWGPTTPQVC